MSLLECPKCGWCHFGVSQEYVDKWEKDWIVFFNSLNEEQRSNYGLKDSPPKADEEFGRCFKCGNKDVDLFFESNKNLFGHTIQPILDRKLK